MSWKCILSDVDVVCYQKSKGNYAVRIEARYQADRWKIYKSYYNNKGLNIIDTFEAKSREEMERILGTLQHQKDPPLAELRKRMVDSRKSIDIKVERAYKEYNVEKWTFTVNNNPEKNILIVRYHDAVDMDFIMTEKLSAFEDEIVHEMLNILGVNPDEEYINTTCYYINAVSKKESEEKDLLQPQFQLDWSDE